MAEATIDQGHPVVTYEEARASGRKRYFTGKPCPRGHVAERLVSSRACYTCSSRRAAVTAPRRRAARSDYYKAKCREAMRKWRAEHPEEARAARKRQRAKNIENERARDREHYRRTKEYQQERHRAYRRNKPHVIAALAAKRRATMLRQTPMWADLAAIRLIYLEAERVTAATGTPHHVDHFIPLQGRSVCGLHCEANLRVVTKRENLEKSNKLPVEA